MAEPTSARVERLSSSFREFLHLADLLTLDDAERRAILGMTAAAWAAWRDGHPMRAAAAPTAAFERRMAYALPLMRRMAASDRTLPPSTFCSTTLSPLN